MTLGRPGSLSRRRLAGRALRATAFVFLCSFMVLTAGPVLLVSSNLELFDERWRPTVVFLTIPLFLILSGLLFRPLLRTLQLRVMIWLYEHIMKEPSNAP